MICGLDEAGRGPLAGPVCAAAVILSDDFPTGILNDSKKMTPYKRENACDSILKLAKWGVGWASVAEIDHFNILQASHLAMRRAYATLHQNVDLAYVDGNQDPHLPTQTQTIVQGDTLYPCIMAASILAKCLRDRYMQKLDTLYPEYCFGQHKGYGTALHRKIVQRIGLCPAHRHSFCQKLCIF
ncbi:MAG: ribonuclease HII [Spirochaetia bacterium]